MAEIGVSVAAKVAEYLVDPVIRQLGYLFNYRRNITDLNQQIERLDLARDRLQRSVEVANRQGDEINLDVQEWLRYVEGIIQRREDFNEDERQASKSCFYLKSRYQLSKQAKNQAAEIVDKIQEASNFDGRVSYRPPPPPPPFISSASFKDYEAFRSRGFTFNQIMEALRNEDLSLIGVWGMGGVGKTTLVKQVAKQAEEDKLFHEVVMVLNISQTPNIAEIQGKIASMLGLEIKAGEDRAVRLRQSLKKQEKILVILDDIWEKLELGEIGIPYGDDHKGCTVLLTSRERRVLSKDMRTQKEFHLQHLSEEEAWNLFKNRAGDSVEKPELRPIAVDVAKKCEGLPVAIVTIANALRDERVPVWENALEELRRAAPTNIRGVSKNVYSCLELSYNHLEGDEVKSLFLLCALMGDGDISMDRLLQYAMGLNLFKGIYSCERAANKLITLVENLKASSLLLDGADEDGGNDRYWRLLFEKSLFFDESMLLRMHDVVRDVARSIACKDPHQFVVKEAVGVQEEWQWMDECRNCTRISLKCKNIDELPQGLVCPKLEFFLLNSSNKDLKIPDAFLQDTKQLRVLDLSEVSLAPSPSSLGFLSNLRTLCLNRCVLEDIAIIGDLKRLQVLSLAGSTIKQLPKEMMQLSDLRVLDLRNCFSLKVIPRDVISSLSRLEYLSMKECSDFEWEKEGFNSGERINNACPSELKHLSGLRTLEVEVRDPSMLPEDEDDVLFDNLNLTRYAIEIGDPIRNWTRHVDEYKSSRRLLLNKVKRLHMVKCFSKLLKRSQYLGLKGLNDTKDVVYELDKEGFVELKYLRIHECPRIQYILHSSTSVEWAPPPNTFCMLEELYLDGLSNLEAVCDGPIPMGFFGNLRFLYLRQCERLKYVFSSLPTQHDGRESLAFPQLQALTLSTLPEVISFYSIGRSSSSEESVTFFNQQITFPSLEILTIHLENVRALCHNQLSADSFPKLRELKIGWCNKLLNIFPSNNLKGLQSLQILRIYRCDALEEIFDLDGFLELKCLTISKCHSIQYILHSSTSVEWAPPPNTFCMLEKLELVSLDNLEAVCDGPIPMGFFGNLRILNLSSCDRLKYVFSLSTQHDGRELALGFFGNLRILNLSSCDRLKYVFSLPTQHDGRELAFPQLRELKLEYLREVISFYSMGRSSGSEESVTLFNEEATFPTLESLEVRYLKNVTALWHDQLPVDSYSKLKKLEIRSCNKLLNIFPSNNLKGLQSLQILTISKCRSIQYILHSSTSVEWAPPPNTFCMLEKLDLYELDNLEAVCDGPIPMGFFGNLRILEVLYCSRLKYVFSLPSTQHGRESLAFPQLQSLLLYELPEVISFYSIRRSSSSEESVTFFNQQATFPTLESLHVGCLENVTALWHDQLPADSFSKLRELEIRSCNKLLNIFPSNILKGLQSLQILTITWCPSIQYILHSTSADWVPPPISLSTQHDGRESLAFPQLQKLRLLKLPEVISFCSIGRSSGSEESVTFFNQQVAFPALESLSVRLENVRALWHNQLSKDSFSKLKKLEINSCNKLLNVFPLSVAKVLVQLEDLEIQSCEVLEAIVANENEAALLISFPKLTSLVLDTLPQLKSFCSGRFTSKWPLLKKLKVHSCDKVEILFQEIGLEGELDNKIQQPLFLVEKEAFPNLEELSLTLKGTMEIWWGQFSRVSYSKLKVLNVIGCHGISVVISSNMVQILHNLERLEVDTCNSVNEVIQVERLSGEEFHVETRPRLTKICLKNLPMLMHLSRSGVYFQNLQTLEINSCGSLINLATPSMAKRLVQLKALTIRNCHMLKEIVGNEEDEPTDDEIDFTRLKRLELHFLPNLKSFCSARYTFRFPSLQDVWMLECPKMEFFCKGVLDTPRLKVEQMAYYHKECWEGDLNTTINKKFMEQNA